MQNGGRWIMASEDADGVWHGFMVSTFCDCGSDRVKLKFERSEHGKSQPRRKAP
jgi:hypothetical protein